jgi:hypothetical protein
MRGRSFGPSCDLGTGQAVAWLRLAASSFAEMALPFPPTASLPGLPCDHLPGTDAEGGTK